MTPELGFQSAAKCPAWAQRSATAYTVITIAFVCVGSAIVFKIDHDSIYHKSSSVANIVRQLQVPESAITFTPSAIYKATNYSSKPTILDDLDSGGGFVTAQGKSSVDVDDIFGFSVYHQLHCIDLMRTTLFPEQPNGGNYETSAHLKHCLAYVRQAIRCAADTTLEHAEGELSQDGHWTFGFDTLGIWHTTRKCRNLGVITGFSKVFSVARYPGWSG